MSISALVVGTIIEVNALANDARIMAAEAAIARFEQSGSVRDARAFARQCYAVVRDVVQQEFPREVQSEALHASAIKVLDAYTASKLDGEPGWLAWALAHELRDLAVAYGLEIEPLRAPRSTARGGRSRTLLGADRLLTVAHEIFRLLTSMSALEEIQQIFGTSPAETAAVFSVSRQAVDLWRKNGLPADRMGDVERVRDVARVLDAELMPERIPQIVRTPARGLAGRSILEVLAGPNGPDDVRAYLARLYSFEFA